jgi:hypothetical protein
LSTLGLTKSSGWRVPLAGLAIAIVGQLAPACEPEKRETAPEPTPSPAPMEQARWRIKTYPAVAFHKLSKAERRRFRGQRERVGTLVRHIYNTLFLNPQRKQAAIDDHFSRRAAHAFRQTNSGVDSHVTRVKTTRRTANIGVEVARARRALAVVTVRARGRLDDRVIHVEHRSKLWLERFAGRWRVIGFDVDQGRPRTRKKH